ncbi:uncharacterized protein Dana_GF24699 [Drosophila ananassae]|uniref:DUF4485 domain-containing protein n=1 Tax=Drosophila ananassae TaxID=7217 RepID=B3M9N1_DROAN|nr:uncharacterized protein LOC6507330 [Drosophila ananassae]EDV39037.1 uncharacterized protein Dana_GF24699 [Drosophila ananassae]
MSDLNECELDRHFKSQLRVMGDVYVKISREDLEVSQRWLELFQKAKRQDKYARNCLMLLMYDQLKELGRLEKPFLDLENLRLRLDDVLSQYEGRKDEDQVSVAGEAADTETNASDYDAASSRCGSQECTSDVDFMEGSCPNFVSIKQANAALLNEISLLHSKTLETEKMYRCQHQLLDKRLAQKPKVRKLSAWQEKIWETTVQSIGRLTEWAGSDYPFDFVSSILGPFLKNEPELSSQLYKLDRHFNAMLEKMVFKECDRREGNVRILYEQLIMAQKEAQRFKDQQMQKAQDALKLEFKKIRALSEDLQRREELIQRHMPASGDLELCAFCQEAAKSQSRSLRPTERQGCPRVLPCEICEGEKCSPTRFKDVIRRNGRRKSIFSEDREKLTEGLSDLSDGKP